MSSPWRRRRPFTPVGALDGEASFRLLLPKKVNRNFPLSSAFPKKSQQKPPSAPVSRLKSKIFTSDLAKKVCPPNRKVLATPMLRSMHIMPCQARHELRNLALCPAKALPGPILGLSPGRRTQFDITITDLDNICFYLPMLTHIAFVD